MTGITKVHDLRKPRFEREKESKRAFQNYCKTLKNLVEWRNTTIRLALAEEFHTTPATTGQWVKQGNWSAWAYELYLLRRDKEKQKRGSEMTERDIEREYCVAQAEVDLIVLRDFFSRLDDEALRLYANACDMYSSPVGQAIRRAALELTGTNTRPVPVSEEV